MNIELFKLKWGAIIMNCIKIKRGFLNYLILY